MKGKPARPIRDVALALLTRRDHSAGELTRKLRTRGFAPADIEAVVTRLQETGLIDERRTVRAIIERETASGRTGPALLRAKLVAKGIAPDVIDECLGALSDDWETQRVRDAAARWAAHHRRRDGAWRHTLARHLRARGFGWEAVRGALDSLGVEDEEVCSNDEP